MIPIATPVFFPQHQTQSAFSFEKLISTQCEHCSSEALYFVEYPELYQNLVFDKDLQNNCLSTLYNCIQIFLSKGGKLKLLDPFSDKPDRYTLSPGSVIYPSCSAGFCRSQTLWARLLPYFEKVTIFPPHATRYGCDPYNGKINWHECSHIGTAEVDLQDEFAIWSGWPKAQRFGFEKFCQWRQYGNNPTEENLKEISDYYTHHYFSADSVIENQNYKKRVYITFTGPNGHANMHRLNQSNERLDDVELVIINLFDFITKPLLEWNVRPYSKESYKKFSDLIDRVLDFSELEN